MKTLRTAAIGLLASAALMSWLAEPFFRYWLNTSHAHAVIFALQAISPQATTATGMGLTAVIVLALLSLGLGFGLVATLYPPLEILLVAIARAALQPRERDLPEARLQRRDRPAYRP